MGSSVAHGAGAAHGQLDILGGGPGSRRQLQQTSAPQCTAYVNNDWPGNTDAWCDSNCLHTPPNCPPSHCKCGAWAMPPPSPPAATADCMADTATPPMNPSAADYIDALRDYTPGLRAFEVCASCNACVAPVQTPAPTPVPTPAPTMASATLVRTLESTVANPDPSLGAAIPDLKASGVEVAGTTFRGAEVVFTLTQQGGVAEAELLLVGALEQEAMRSLIGGSMGFDPAQSTFGVTVQQAVFPPRPPPMAPPTPPSPPPPTPPPPPPHPPPSTEVVVIRMTAHGDVEDYTPNVTASLQANFATAAGVDASLVTIAVEPGSVLITATIAVPAAMQSYAVRNLIKTKLGTPEAASAALGITVSSAPNFVITSNTASAPIVDAEAMQNEKQSEKLPDGIIVGICLGVMVIGLVAILGVRHYRKAQKAAQTLERNVKVDASTKNLTVHPTDAPPAGKADGSDSWMAAARAAGWGPAAGASSDSKDNASSTYV